MLENELLSKHTSFKIGGPADLFIYINNEQNLSDILKLFNLNNIPFFVLGNGSNLLVSDTGFRGVIIVLDHNFKNIKLDGESSLICGSGVSLSQACIFAMKNNLSGLEFAYGIPGAFGGALFMNAGAYGSDMSNIINQATHIDLDGNINTLNKSDMNLSYRKSLYSEKNYIITSVKINLNKDSKENIKSRMEDIISRRKSKQPLEYPSAGSTFKRPVNNYAAALIESCNLKGVSIGDAMVSPKHSGFIINTGNATAQNICDLINLVKNRVFEQTGVLLECEVKTLGDIKI